MSNISMTLKQLIDSGWDIGLNDYPIFDETYRNVLNNKIISRYYFMDIGAETPALFIFYLKRKMNEIMVYYNKMYESERLKIEPLTRLNYSETFGRTTEGSRNVSNSQNTNTRTKDVQSDTPQQMLSINDIEGEVYASFAGIGDGSSSSTSNANETADTTENYLKNIVGNNASRTDSQMLIEFRNTFLNIDLMILEELGTLFSLEW